MVRSQISMEYYDLLTKSIIKLSVAFSYLKLLLTLPFALLVVVHAEKDDLDFRTAAAKLSQISTSVSTLYLNVLLFNGLLRMTSRFIAAV